MSTFSPYHAEYLGKQGGGGDSDPAKQIKLMTFELFISTSYDRSG